MNQRMMELLQGHTSQYPKVLETHFPHVFNKLIECWGTHQMVPYLDELMMSKRPGRQGFPPEAATEIWAISSLYSTLYPEARSGLATNVWLEDRETAHTDWKESTSTKK